MNIINNSYIKVVILFLISMMVFSPYRTLASNKGAEGSVIIKDKVSYKVVSLYSLGFGYKPPSDVELPDGNIQKGAATPMTIPDEIKALNGMKVAIEGFVLPLETEGNTVKTFLFAGELMSCLFCQMLGFDQWVFAKTVNSKGIRLSDRQFEEPVHIYGTLAVGEEFDGKQLSSLYRISVDAIDSGRKKFMGLF